MLDGITCVIIATVVMLVLMLVFKVPVFVSIFAACMSYFILNPNASVGMQLNGLRQAWRAYPCWLVRSLFLPVCSSTPVVLLSG